MYEEWFAHFFLRIREQLSGVASQDHEADGDFCQHSKNVKVLCYLIFEVGEVVL